MSSLSKLMPLFFLVLTYQMSLAQHPADIYKDAYKKFLRASCPILEDSIRHFVYFSRDRESMVNHPFLQHNRFKGAQIMYSWRQLERQKGKYDFSIIKQDLKYLKKHGKKLFIQLQDVTFSPQYKAIPNYLLTEEYGGGACPQHNDLGEEEGWVAKRWNPAVRERFALLLQALGKQFDGKIEGVNLQETAIGVSEAISPDFTEEGYINGLKANMLAMKKAFPTSTTMIYANFTPGEWLPWKDKGYLSGLYAYGEEIGVGLGSPDLLVRRKGQLNHPLKFMHEGRYTVPIGIAVQDGNYVGQTGADDDYEEQLQSKQKNRSNKVPMLQAFAKDFLRVDYMFWVNQEPYFAEDVMSCFEERK